MATVAQTVKGLVLFGLIRGLFIVGIIPLGLTEAVFVFVVFVVSIVSHYVWLYNYLYRGRKLGIPLERFPNPWETLLLGLNVSFTVAAFLDLCRRLFKWRTIQFMPVWAGVLFVVYVGVALGINIFWIDIYKHIILPWSQPDPIDIGPSTATNLEIKANVDPTNSDSIAFSTITNPPEIKVSVDPIAPSTTTNPRVLSIDDLEYV